MLTWRKSLSREKLVFSDELLEQLSEELIEEPPQDMTDLVYLEQCCSELPPARRQLLDWFYKDGETLKRISTRLNRPIGTIGCMLAQIRENLRACVNGKRKQEGLR